MRTVRITWPQRNGEPYSLEVNCFSHRDDEMVRDVIEGLGMIGRKVSATVQEKVSKPWPG